jgi:uncharacterized protein YbaR (Trm112 family)
VAPGAATLNVAESVPVEVGAKTTLTVQNDPTGTGVEQLFVCENWPAAFPVSEIPVMGNAAVPRLVTVIGFGAL